MKTSDVPVNFLLIVFLVVGDAVLNYLWNLLGIDCSEIPFIVLIVLQFVYTVLDFIFAIVATIVVGGIWEMLKER